jgi:hypothetical protein
VITLTGVYFESYFVRRTASIRAPHKYGKPRPAYYGGKPFGELLDYAKHHNLPHEVIDTLEDFHNKVTWMALQGAGIAIEGLSEAITPAPRATTASASGPTNATPARGQHYQTWARNWAGRRE